MRLFATIRTPLDAYDVLVTAEPETRVADLRAELGFEPSTVLTVDGRALDDEETLGQSALISGSVLDVGSPRGMQPGPPEARNVLWVTSGPDAGRSLPLIGASVTIGRAPACDLVLHDPSVSAAHLRIFREGDTFSIVDLDSANGTTVDGEPVPPPPPADSAGIAAPAEVVELALGAAVGLGATMLAIEAVETTDADVQPDGEGGLAFNRPTRLRPAPPDVAVSVPALVREDDPWPFPWAQVITPLVMAGAFLLLFKRPEMILFAVMSPVLALSSTMTTKKRTQRRRLREQEKFDRAMLEAEATTADAVADQTASRRAQFPHPGALRRIATGPQPRVWERRHHDVDALEVRVGAGDALADIKFNYQSNDRPISPPMLRGIPLTVPLKKLGVIGVAGTTERARAVGRWLVAQLAALHPPTDVNVVVLTDSDSAEDWAWVRWLPHTHSDDPQRPISWIGNDRATRPERVRELLRLLDARKEAAGNSSGVDFVPSIVVVLDGARPLRSIPGLVRLLREGPGYGIFTIALDDDRTRLPEEARAEIVLDADPQDWGWGDLFVDEMVPRRQITIDTLSPADAEAIARGLAPLRATGGDSDTTIPNSVRFVDLAGIDLDDVDSIRGRWALSPRSTDALVGVSIDGPFAIDLKRDGPHALVAGTTGAGKSEFLQTLVASLAFVNRPDALNFVLVDYKGASAFADCENLPHTVGLVSNLDGHLTQRALISLDAELKRREHVLRDLGVPDIDGAWSKDPDLAATSGLARLVLVIDEFAELVHELPDFITGLIRIARVGRSLGVHLILATQRPSGVVTPEMRANTGLRVALRMEDKADSTEVIDAPMASAISRASPGRAYVRTGSNAAVVQFQSARVAGRRPGTAVESLPPPEVLPVTWRRLGHPLTGPARAQVDDDQATDLHALVALISETAELEASRARFRPWLPPLPDQVLIHDLPAAGPSTLAAAAAGAALPSVAIGLEDLPRAQRQDACRFDVTGGSHLVIAGSARSGRSTALRAIAAALVAAIAPTDVHLYGLDFGNGALRPLADLAHCGAVVTATETDRTERLVQLLIEEMARRQENLAEHGFGDLAEQRAAVAPVERLPYVVILLDRWEGMVSTFPLESGSEVPASITRILREGPSMGFRLVISGDRSILSHRDAAHVPTKLILRMADPNDYRLADINPRTVPDAMVPGRALRPEGDAEVQFALLHPDPSGQAQAAAVRALVGRFAPPPEALAPIHVDVLPRRLDRDELSMLARRHPDSDWWVSFGAGGDRLQQQGCDLLSVVPGLLIGGPRRSGRSTTLANLALATLAKGHPVVWIAARDTGEPARVARSAGAVVVEAAAAKDESAIKEAVASCASVPLVLIDDAEAIARSEADDWLCTELPPGSTTIAAVVAAGTTEDLRNELRGIIPTLRRGAAGLVLCPGSILDGDLLGGRFDRNQLGGPPGRGLFSISGEPIAIQVPSG